MTAYTIYKNRWDVQPPVFYTISNRKENVIQINVGQQTQSDQ